MKQTIVSLIRGLKSFMDKIIRDDEVLYRAVKLSATATFVNDRPTPVLFFDPKGVSVNRENNRTLEQILSLFSEKFKRYDKVKAIVSLTAEICRKIGTKPIVKHAKKDETHAEIHHTEKEIVIPNEKCLLLARSCTVCYIDKEIS